MFESYYLDITVLMIYFVICLGIGLYKATKVRTLQGFALGETSLPFPILVTTIIACSFGAGSTIGYSEKIFKYGTIYILCLLFQPVFWLITSWIFTRNIEKFAGCLSISEIMFRLYGAPGRWVTSIAAIIVSLGIIAAQASAIGYVFHYFFGISLTAGIFISYSVLTLYSALGGIRAVVLTEIFQFGLFFFILPISFIMTFDKLGGAEDIMQKLPLTEWGLEFSLENLPFAASLIFFILIPNILAPSVQRYLMAPNAKTLGRSLKLIALLTIPLELSICIIAYIVKAYAPDINPADTFVYYIANFLPIGIKSLMITGVIAIIMSVAESFLNTCSVIIVNDIIKVLYPKISTAKQLIALRLNVILLSLLSVFLALAGFGLLNLIILVQNFWMTTVLVPICAGFLGLKTNSKSFVVSTIVGLTFTFLSGYYAGELGTSSMSLGCLGSALGLFGMHYWQQTYEIAKIKPYP